MQVAPIQHEVFEAQVSGEWSSILVHFEGPYPSYCIHTATILIR